MKYLLITYLFSFVATANDCPMPIKTENLCAKIVWETKPSIGTIPYKFTLSISEKEKPSKNVDTKAPMRLRTWMVMDNGHNHGGAPLNVEKQGPGVYKVSNAIFYGGMKGTWYIELLLLDGEDVLEVVKYEIVP